MTDEDYFLRSTIAETIATAFREVTLTGGAEYEFADRVLAAIGDRGQRWVVKKRDQWFEAATDGGDAEAEVPGCWHYYQYSNTTVAGGAEKNLADTDYLHICELDDHIATLIGLRELYRRWRDGETLPLCDHPVPDGGGRCQACGHQGETAVGVAISDYPEDSS